MPKIIWSCQHCGQVMPVWKVRCPNCRKPAVSWLHVVAGAAIVLPGLFLLLKLL